VFHPAERQLTSLPVLGYCSGQKRRFKFSLPPPQPVPSAKGFDFSFAQKIAKSLR
jgi:hypothetical protein